MKTLVVAGLLTCAANCAKYNNSAEPVQARITYYDPSQDPRWGNKVAWHPRKAQFGVTVAAEKKYEFGREVYIPELKGVVGDGHFIVQDRGPAVEKRIASRGKAPVFDVYVPNAKTRRKLMTSQSEYMKVYIKK